MHHLFGFIYNIAPYCCTGYHLLPLAFPIKYMWRATPITTIFSQFGIYNTLYLLNQMVKLSNPIQSPSSWPMYCWVFWRAQLQNSPRPQLVKEYWGVSSSWESPSINIRMKAFSLSPRDVLLRFKKQNRTTNIHIIALQTI